LNNSIRTTDEFSTKLPVTDLNGAPRRGADSNLHWYKINGGDGNNNEIAENQDDITNIKNFLLYNMNSDLKIRIEL
jgi:hypothetical protein